ncbi:N-acetylneuraminate synthase family protein [Candidatus Pelagibacter sp.]|nr:N-acetylneuraminate synthase family protein [Candidatus Pelagibacter sp.]
MSPKFKVSNQKILNSHSKPYVIAEIGVNHDCSITKAKKLISQAKNSGADAVKFQTYKAELIASKEAKAYWNIKKEKISSQYNLFKKYDKFGEKEYVKLFKFCKKKKIEFLSTPFDLVSVDMLNPMVSFFKISSSDITNFPLIKKIALKNKPILISTGASSISEISNALQLIKKYNKKDVCIMHCILNYPTKNKDANLRMITSLKNKFPNYLIGYSDHTLPDTGMINLLTAYSLGAIILEKHFTDDKTKVGNDHYHAMDKDDLKKFTIKAKYINQILGSSDKKRCLPSELKSKRNARRSLVVKSNMHKDQIIKSKDVICKRPGTGIESKHIDNLKKYKLKKDISEDSVLKWSYLKKI